MTPLDPRSVANLLVEFSNEIGRPVTPLSLQKILYFIHGQFLITTGEPLIEGYFEAWQYGPVHPLVYDAFKKFGSRIVDKSVDRRDLFTGVSISVDIPSDFALCSLIKEMARPYFMLSAGRLVDVSHARGSPWDVLTIQTDGSRSYGMRITDDKIRGLFKRHKVSVTSEPRVGEPDEESPPH